ncbi:antitoxin [Georgenia sp. AZ-5]|uniref:antitoxin n=1 Tax=Georgenia sp. AZ-5 TaxID=3367526 RepID=UPI0037545B03
MGIGDKAKDFLSTDKGEQKSDDALEKGSDFVSDKTGGKYDERLDKGVDAADDRIGTTGDTTEETGR